MRLPVKYSVRSLSQRKLRSALTLLGVGVSIFMAVLMLSMTRGLLACTVATGEPLNIVVLSKGASSLEFSALDPQALHLLEGIPGLQKDAGGAGLISPEMYLNSRISSAGGGEPQACIVRGVRPAAFDVHPQVSLSSGELPERGSQIAVGSLVAARLNLPADALKVGALLEFEGQSWQVSGVLSAPGTAFEGEIWAPLDDLMIASKRPDYSALVMRAAGPGELESLLFDLGTRTDVRSSPVLESAYYSALAEQMKPVQAVSTIMTVLLVLGGLMTGMNTMFNSVLSRTREMAVLMVLGYRRNAVLAGFVIEGVLLCCLGGLLGSLCGLLLNGLPMKIPMGAFRFVVDGLTIGTGVGLALVIGLLGSALPVLRVARLSITEGLRAQ